MSSNEFDFVSVLGVCGLVGYEAEINQCIGLNKDTRSDFHLLLTVSKVNSHVYTTRNKHRIQYAVLTANTEWFDTLFAVCNRRDIANLRTYYNETLIHLLCGYCYDLNNRGRLVYRTCGCCFYDGGYNPHPIRYAPKSLQIFKKLIPIGIDINIRLTTEENLTVGGYTALMLTVVGNNRVLFNEILRYRKKLGVNVNVRSDDWEETTAIHLACELGHTEMVQRLCLEPDIDIVSEDYFHKTPLQLTAAAGVNRYNYRRTKPFQRNTKAITNSGKLYRTVFKTLRYTERFDSNTPIEPAVSTELEKAFRTACQCNAVQQVRWFCRIPNFRVDSKDSKGYTGFQLAAQHGHLGVMKELIRNQKLFSVDHIQNDGKKALKDAVLHSHLPIVKFLCAYDNIPLEDPAMDSSCNILGIAISFNYIAIIDELLKYRHRINLYHRDSEDCTYFDIICKYDNADVVPRLIDSHTLTTYRDNDENTFLMVAVKNRAGRVMNVLLKSVPQALVDINTPNVRGETALYLACKSASKRQKKRCFRYGRYYRHGAAIDSDDGPNAPISIVKQLCNVVDIDFQYTSTSGDTAYTIAAETSEDSIVLELLKHREKYDINFRNQHGETMFLIVCRKNKVDLVRYLCGIPNVNINCENHSGNTPFAIASSLGHTDTVSELLKYRNRIDVNHRNTVTGETALHLACRHNRPGIVQLLCTTEGVDLNLDDNNGYNPLTTAACYGYTDIIEILLKYRDRVHINHRIKDGRIALYLAVQRNKREVVRMLCRAEGIDVNLGGNNYGNGLNNPLAIAIRKGYPTEIIDVLRRLQGCSTNSITNVK